MTARNLAYHFNIAVLLLLLAMVTSYMWPDNEPESSTDSEAADVISDEVPKSVERQDPVPKPELLVPPEISIEKPAILRSKPAVNSEAQCDIDIRKMVKEVAAAFKITVAEEQSDELKLLLGGLLVKKYDLYKGTEEEFEPFWENYTQKHIAELTAEWQSTGEPFLASLLMERCLTYRESELCDQSLVTQLLSAESDNGYVQLLGLVFYDKANQQDKLLQSLENTYLATTWKSHKTEYMLRTYAEIMATTNHALFAFGETMEAQVARFKVPNNALAICKDPEYGYSCFQLGAKLAQLDVDNPIQLYGMRLQNEYLDSIDDKEQMKALQDKARTQAKLMNDLAKDLRFPNHPEFSSFLIQLAYTTNQLDAMRLLKAEADRIHKQYPNVCNIK